MGVNASDAVKKDTRTTTENFIVVTMFVERVYYAIARWKLLLAKDFQENRNNNQLLLYVYSLSFCDDLNVLMSSLFFIGNLG